MLMLSPCCPIVNFFAKARPKTTVKVKLCLIRLGLR